MIREEIVHINGAPKKLIVFLHGYLDSSDAIDQKLHMLSDSLPSVAVHIPQAPFACEVEPHMRQWYSMYRFDPGYERKNAPSMKEFVGYYNRMSLGLEEACGYLQPYLEQTLSEYGLDYKDLFLCGFSQGAMTAIYTALMCPEEIGGLISFSGIMAGHEHLLKHARSHPRTMLLHGTEDTCLRLQSMEFTARQLEKLGCQVECKKLAGIGHSVSTEAIESAIDFIKKIIKEDDKSEKLQKIG